jgi:hypothetical protein
MINFGVPTSELRVARFLGLLGWELQVGCCSCAENREAKYGEWKRYSAMGEEKHMIASYELLEIQWLMVRWRECE